MHGRWERWPHGVGWGWRTDLNTGVVFFRSTNGSKAFLQERRAPRRDAIVAYRRSVHVKPSRPPPPPPRALTGLAARNARQA